MAARPDNRENLMSLADQLIWAIEGYGSLVYVRERPAASQGPRRTINLIEGANVTITVADNVGNEEIDVTIASAVGGSDPNDQFFAAPDPDGYIGPYASMSMLDGADTVVRQTFRLPNNWTDSWGVSLVVIPAATGDLRRTITTNFCAAGEVYNTHTDSIAAGVQAVTLNEQELIDITAALTGAAMGDLVGVEYLRDALTSAADTVAATVHYIGVLLTEA